MQQDTIFSCFPLIGRCSLHKQTYLDWNMILNCRLEKISSDYVWKMDFYRHANGLSISLKIKWSFLITFIWIRIYSSQLHIVNRLFIRYWKCIDNCDILVSCSSSYNFPTFYVNSTIMSFFLCNSLCVIGPIIHYIIIRTMLYFSNIWIKGRS
jgi:hypothetical protein